MKMFSDGEMLRRVNGLRSIMDETGLDAVISSSFHSTLYYSGFWMLTMGRFAVTVVPKGSEPALIAPIMDQERAATDCWISDRRFYRDEENSLEGTIRLTKEVLSERGVSPRRLGVEEDVMPEAVHRTLRESFPGSEFVDVSSWMMDQRLVKSPEEVGLLRTVGEVSDVGTEVVMEGIREGRTETEISNEGLTAMDEKLARQFPGLESFFNFLTITSGPRSMIPHGCSSGRRLRRGDIINFNAVPIVSGYYASQERTLSLGPLPEAARRPFETTMEAHERGLEAVKAGVRCSEVANACVDVLRREGYDQNQLHGPGHSCGIMGVFWGREEKGEIRVYNDNPLHEGMVITIEPAIYLPGIGGFRHCDVVAVTKEGYDLLTHYKRGILRVD